MATETRDRNAIALAALRISVGMLFLIFGDYKVFEAEFIWRGGFQFWINRFLRDGAYPFMLPVLQKFVLPHATAMAFLVAYGELVMGLAMVLGMVIRAASICALIYMLTLLFCSNYPGPQAAFWQYFGASLDHSVLALCLAAFILGEAGRALSIRSYRPMLVGREETSATCSSPESRNRTRDELSDLNVQGAKHE